MKKNKGTLTAALFAGLALGTPLRAEDIVVKPFQTGDERRLDNPVDAWMTAWSGAAGSEVKGPPAWRGDFRRHDLLSDDAKNGDFSLTFTVGNPAKESAFGITCGKYISHWNVGPGASLHVWIKVAGAGGTDPVKMALYDVSGKQALFAVDALMPDEWRELDMPLTKFKAAEGFDFNALRAVQVEAKLPKGAQIWLDDVYFHEGKTHLGVSDKTITQYMAETAATRSARADEDLQTSAGGAYRPSWVAYARGEKEKADRLFTDYLTTIMDPKGLEVDTYNLHEPKFGRFLIDFYHAFSSKGLYRPNSMSPEVEGLLLKAIRLNDELGNDICKTRETTWNVEGSENHDYNKSKWLLASQIFMNVPEYADCIYPNPGRTLGVEDPHDIKMHWLNDVKYATQDTGNYSDGKPYRAKDHYKAWVAFWKEYMAERARYGFFNEQGAAGAYGLAPIFNFHSIHAFVADKELREQTKMFLDLMYFQWLQDQLLLIQGGASCRGNLLKATSHRPVVFLMGGPGSDWSLSLDADYQWPREVWEMALDRKGRGEYAYISRKPHEARDETPRPEGTSNVMLWRPDSRIVRYSWVTPDYVMGLRMDHPNALYTHIFMPDQAITFPTGPLAGILLNLGQAYRAVQERNVVLVQQKHFFTVQNPPDFPAKHIREKLLNPEPCEAVIGKDVDVIEEEGGWVFVQEGKAYVAIRVVTPGGKEPLGRDGHGYGLLPAAKDNYELVKDDKGVTTLRAKDALDPLVIETSRTAHHATLADFKKDVLDNPLHLKTHLAYFGNRLTYRSCDKDAKELYLNLINMEAPRIDGKYVTYDPPTFDSPWLNGSKGSGVVTLTGPVSGRALVLDFNKRSPKTKKTNE